MRCNVWANLSEPLHDAWFHAVYYYRFNRMTYQKFPIDLWENICSWIGNKTKSYILDWTFGKVLQYSNINHTCPYQGEVFVKVNNISISKFPFEQFLPAGKFRIDINITSGNRKIVFAMTQLFISISDNRIEQF